MNTDDEYLTPRELADRTGVSIALIRKYMREGELEYIEYSPKNRRIRYTSWLDLVDRKTRGAR
ncbi:MAG: helix-turn-helix domain-containing protein [Halioglobus sp.]